VFQIPQPILAQVLKLRTTAPERLSQHETEIANRICWCSLCGWLWVRNPTKLPERCPHCHKRAWDRPLLTALLAASHAQPTPLVITETAKPLLTTHKEATNGQQN
jgi:hypothetical protein